MLRFLARSTEKEAQRLGESCEKDKTKKLGIEQLFAVTLCVYFFWTIPFHSPWLVVVTVGNIEFGPGWVPIWYLSTSYVRTSRFSNGNVFEGALVTVGRPRKLTTNAMSRLCRAKPPTQTVSPQSWPVPLWCVSSPGLISSARCYV